LHSTLQQQQQQQPQQQQPQPQPPSQSLQTEATASAVVGAPAVVQGTGSRRASPLLRQLFTLLAPRPEDEPGAAAGAAPAGSGSVLEREGVTEVSFEGGGVFLFHSRGFRPDHLPPKPREEAVRHQREVTRQQQQYREKLRRERAAVAERRKKEQEKAARERREREEREKRSQARENKLSEAARELVNALLPTWGQARTEARVRDMVWRLGIPPQVRGQVWPRAIGNLVHITPELFDIFYTQAQNARNVRQALLNEVSAEPRAMVAAAQRLSVAQAKSASADGPHPVDAAAAAAVSGGAQSKLSKENTFSYIDVDLTRTFPSLMFFSEECVMNRQLRNILETYCFYRPDIG
jgi:hypothetical protein